MKNTFLSLLTLICSILITLAKPQDPQVRFVVAAMEGDTETVKRLLAEGLDVNAHHAIAYKAVGSAWKCNILETMELLSLVSSKIPDPQFKSSATLFSAGRYGMSKEIKKIIESGTDPKVENSLVLFLASSKGQTEVVQVLLEKGADPKAENSRALIAASTNGHAEIVKLLLEKGADPKAQDGLALKAALYNGDVEIVKLFL